MVFELGHKLVNRSNSVLMSELYVSLYFVVQMVLLFYHYPVRT